MTQSKNVLRNMAASVALAAAAVGGSQAAIAQETTAEEPAGPEVTAFSYVGTARFAPDYSIVYDGPYVDVGAQVSGDGYSGALIFGSPLEGGGLERVVFTGCVDTNQLPSDALCTDVIYTLPDGGELSGVLYGLNTLDNIPLSPTVAYGVDPSDGTLFGDVSASHTFNTDLGVDLTGTLGGGTFGPDAYARAALEATRDVGGVDLTAGWYVFVPESGGDVDQTFRIGIRRGF